MSAGVLAVMRRDADHASNWRCDRTSEFPAHEYGRLLRESDEAIAAVAELIEVLESYKQRDEFQQGADVGNDPRHRRAVAALARCGVVLPGGVA